MEGAKAPAIGKEPRITSVTASFSIIVAAIQMNVKATLLCCHRLILLMDLFDHVRRTESVLRQFIFGRNQLKICFTAAHSRCVVTHLMDDAATDKSLEPTL